MTQIWADLDAPRWVYRLGVLQTALVCLCTVAMALFAIPLGPVALAFPAVAGVFAGFSAWATSAWRRGRPWAWWFWSVSSGLDVMLSLVDLGAAGSSWSAWYSLANGVGLLVLLSHPANRDRSAGPVEPFPVNAHPADPSYYS